LRSLTDEGSVEDQTVFRGIVFSLESAEESLFSTKNLNGRSRVFSERHEGTSVGDQSSTDEFSNEGGKVGSDSGHTVSEVFVEFRSVLSDRDDLVTEEVDVVEILLRDFSSHRDGGGGFESLFEFFGEDVREVGGIVVGSESHSFDNLGVGDVFGNDLAHLGEVPSVPFLQSNLISTSVADHEQKE